MIQRVVSNHKTFITERPVATPGEGTHFSVNSERFYPGPGMSMSYEDLKLIEDSGAAVPLGSRRDRRARRCQLERHLTAGPLDNATHFQRALGTAFKLDEGADVVFVGHGHHSIY